MVKKMMKLASYTLAERPDLIDEQERLMQAQWPEFVTEGEGGLGWNALFSEFREYQFVLLDGETIVGIGKTIPLALEAGVEDLPPEGREWAITKGRQDKSEGTYPDTLCALSATVVTSHRRRGIASLLLEQMRRIARAEGLGRLIAPVRPSRKSEFPLIPMTEYAQWRRHDGEPFDPWLRVHLRAGGEIVRVASRSMTIDGSLHEWSRWTGLEFPGSGSYIIPDGLVPLQVDVEAGHASYVEPNVWVVHRL